METFRTSRTDLKEVTLETIRLMMDNEAELVTLIYGEGAEEELANSIQDQVLEEYEEVEVDDF